VVPKSGFRFLSSAKCPDYLWSMVLTTELHLVLRLRNDGAIPLLPTPCLLQHAGTTFTVPFLSQLFGAAVFSTFIEPKVLLPCSQETTAGALSTANCVLQIV
jgi:hypothetical protein